MTRRKVLIIVGFLVLVFIGASEKITELVEELAPVGGDFIAIVDDPAGTPVTKKATIANVVTDGNLSTSDVATNNVSSTKHGFAPKSPSDATQFLNGAVTPAYAAVKDSDLSTSDITTNDVSTTKHGFTPKAPNNAAQFLDGTGAWDTVKDSDLSTTDITTNDVTSTKHGFAPKSPANAAQFLNGAATPAYAAVTDSDLSTSDITTNDVSTTKHGFAPKAPNESRRFLNGAAAYTAPTRIVTVLVSDPNGAVLDTGNGKAYFRIPSDMNGYDLIAVAASVSTVSSSGTPTWQIRRNRGGSDVDMLSTLLTIDANETDSSTATAAAVIDGANDDVQTADQIYIDRDVAGTGTKGDVIQLTFGLP